MRQLVWFLQAKRLKQRRLAAAKESLKRRNRRLQSRKGRIRRQGVGLPGDADIEDGCGGRVPHPTFTSSSAATIASA